MSESWKVSAEDCESMIGRLVRQLDSLEKSSDKPITIPSSATALHCSDPCHSDWWLDADDNSLQTSIDGIAEIDAKLSKKFKAILLYPSTISEDAVRLLEVKTARPSSYASMTQKKSDAYYTSYLILSLLEHLNQNEVIEEKRGESKNRYRDLRDRLPSIYDIINRDVAVHSVSMASGALVTGNRSLWEIRQQREEIDREVDHEREWLRRLGR